MLEERLSRKPGSASAERARCAADTVYWINTYCVTYDPRTDGKAISFKLFPKQVEFIGWLGERKLRQESGLCEKSRGVGVSFLAAADSLHDWLFVPGCKIGFGSRKLEYVDQIGNLDSIFEKIRFMLRRLPAWMYPTGFKWNRHDNHARLLNPETGAAITGEGGDEIGRGGRTSIYYVDEAAFLERPDMAESSLVETTNVRIDISTPNGPGNPFAVKRHSLPPERVFTFHWKDDPRKNEEWAAKTKAEKGLTVFACEYDIDYGASIAGITIPGAWVRAAVGLDLLPSSKCVAGLDIGEEGDDLSVFISRRGPKVNVPVSWSKELTTTTAWRARDEATAAGATDLYYDSVGVGAGVKGTFNTSETALPFNATPVNTGEAPTDNIWPDGQSSKEKFLNLKGELWWSLRTRFERTFEHVSGQAVHEASSMISIPNHPQLIAELSLPLHFRTESGKIKMESKEQLARRGIKSPDFAEALVLSEMAYVSPRKMFWYEIG
jgi:hypothetical protein